MKRNLVVFYALTGINIFNIKFSGKGGKRDFSHLEIIARYQ